MRLLLAAVLSAGWTLAQTPSVDEIMARVAANQDRALGMRTNWVYEQKQLLRMVRGNGKLAREEHREYVVTPGREGIDKQLVKFDGKYESKGQFYPYEKPGYTYKEMDIDGELIDDLSQDLAGDKSSKDGISNDLFPLTAKQQPKYRFRLAATEDYRGRRVYRVAFEPRRDAHSGGDAIWKGEALIDAGEFQPVMIHSTMAIGIPAAVKILLGTNIRGLGFSVAYRKFEEGLWFPVSYGGEFEIRAVFFYKRTISINLTNGDFRRADVTSNVAYVTEKQ